MLLVIVLSNLLKAIRGRTTMLTKQQHVSQFSFAIQ